jgi:hypothetical protein
VAAVTLLTDLYKLWWYAALWGLRFFVLSYSQAHGSFQGFITYSKLAKSLGKGVRFGGDGDKGRSTPLAPAIVLQTVVSASMVIVVKLSAPKVRKA